VRVGCFDGDEAVDKPLNPTRQTDAHVARSQVEGNGQRLQAGDAATPVGEPRRHLAGGRGAEGLAFDLAR
jgi:hypothetical protein